MFAESLLESSGGVKTSQRWTWLLSLSLEAVVIGLLVLLPLLENQALPRLRWVVTASLAPPPRGVLPSGAGGGGGTGQDSPTAALTPPNVIPLHTDLTPDAQAANPGAPGADLPRGVPWGVQGSVGPILSTPPVASPPQTPAPPQHSVLTEGNVIYRVLPTYPPVARQIGAQGPVVLHLVISKEGAVENLRVVSSAHPLLNAAALDAVRQWRFRPYLLNGVAVEAEAQITVNFIMSR
jgi:periplasmic protein TonB